MTESFDWQALLAAKAYASFPEAPYKPLIGITGNYGEQTCKIAEGYYQSIAKAGGVPVVIPPLSDTTTIINTLEHLDGLLLSGGADYDPRYAGEEPWPTLGEVNQERDLPELFITQLAYNRQIPILGICRGIQTLAMVLGGHVRQDISDIQQVKHSQEEARHVATHRVTIDKDSILYHLYNETTLNVNSFHHQAVDDAGPRFRVVAKSEDGIVEAIESTEYKSIVGVQWHPECLEEGLPLFQWLVGEATQYHAACETHRRVLTLDTHCDTPMFFDQIEDIVKKNSDYVSIARTPADLWTNKQQGRKSIMLGIENGHALEGSLDNLRHFAERGIVYMTLCHNGDNDICDSARGSQTHGGVSAFGKEVIREMNRLGIMVDLSHAAASSFYDALELSKTPIVCSHSSCRALCDHPRNLTDDQMRALAKKGGVMQVTLYNGFLVKDGEATIEDAMRHLEHAIEVMGIDHVGLGTDFDGDGGIRGLANSAELIQFTRQLLARRYTEEDIQKIWGGNFLRVMQLVQSNKQ